MTRPYDWTPLAAGDPIPGDPEAVERAGRDYARIADAIEVAAARLRDIAANVDMQSDAVAAIRTRAEEIAGRISKAHGRYEAMSSALLGYALVLTETQTASIRALNEARDALADQVLAGRLASAAQWHIDTAAPLADNTPHLTDLAGARNRQAAAADRLALARTTLDRAIQDRDDAAEAARRIIDAAKSADHLNDSRWANIKQSVVATLEVVAHAVDLIAIGAGVLALVLGWVPILGEFLAAVALIASIASLALKLTLKALGEGSWTDIAWAAVGVAAFGVGKVAVGEAHVAAEGAQGAARIAAGRLAAQSAEARIAAGAPGFSNSSRVLEEMVDMSEFASRDAAEDLVRRATQRGEMLGRAWESIRAIPGQVSEDVANIRQFDLGDAITELRNGAPMHPLSLLGERAAAADAQAVEHLHPVLKTDPLVGRILRQHDVTQGAFVMTWQTGTLLLARDVRGEFAGEPGPTDALHLMDNHLSTGAAR